MICFRINGERLHLHIATGQQMQNKFRLNDFIIPDCERISRESITQEKKTGKNDIDKQFVREFVYKTQYRRP